jgi:hypothetical protein
LAHEAKKILPDIRIVSIRRVRMNGMKPTFLDQQLDRDSLKQAIQDALEQVFESPANIPLLFSDDYVQTTDGRTSNRQEFEQHIRHLLASVNSIDFEVLDAVQQGQSIADRHLVQLVYQDGRKATIEINLFGTVTDGRLSRVHEISRVVSGDEMLKALVQAQPGERIP